MKEKYINIENLSVSEILYDFVNKEAIPGTNINKQNFWYNFSKAVQELSPKNKALLKFRQKLQMDIDKWHLDNKDKEFSKIKVFASIFRKKF